MDDRIDVGISVQSDKAEAGAKQASDALAKAVAGIQQQLERMVTTTQAQSAAMASGFNGMSQAVVGAMDRIGAATRANATIVDDYGNEVAGVSRRVVQSNDEQAASHARVGHAAAGARREMLVIAHELFTGNLKRAAGSVMVLGERLDWLGKIMSPTGAAIGIGIAAFGAMAVAAFHGAEQMAALRNSLILTGNYAGVTGGQFIEMGNAIASATGSKISSARDALAAVASTGRFTGEALQPVAAAIAKIGEYSKVSAEEVVKNFEKMDEGVYKWAVQYNQQYHFATLAQLEHIRALEEQGQKEKAEAETAQLVIDKIKQTAIELGQYPGLLDRASQAWHRFWDEAAGAGRAATVEDRIANLKQDLANQQSTFGPGGYQGSAAYTQAQIRRLEQQRDQQQSAAGVRSNSEKIQGEGSKAVAELRSEFKGLGGSVELANEEIDRFRTKIEKAKAAAKDTGDALPKDIQSMIANQAKIEENIRKRYDRSDKVKAPKGLETTGGQYANENAHMQADLAVLKEKLKEEQGELDRAHAANKLNLQTYYSERLRITLEGMDKEREVVAAQLAQTKALEASAKTAADRLSMKTKEIELEGRLSVMDLQRAATIKTSGDEAAAAAAKELKAMEDLEAKKTVLAAQETQKRLTMLADYQAREGEISSAQRLQLEMKLAQQETDAAVTALQKRLDVEKNLTLEARQQLEDEKTALIEANGTKQLQYTIQLAEQEAQYQQEAIKSVDAAMSTFFQSVVTGQKKVGQAFLDLGQQIQNGLVKAVTGDMMNQFMGAGSKGGGYLQTLTGDLFKDKYVHPDTNGPGGLDALGKVAKESTVAQQTIGTVANSAMTTVGTILVSSAGSVIVPGSAGSGGGSGLPLGSLLGSLGGAGAGDYAGAFGFTATGAAGSADAVMAGLGSAGADSAGMSALMGLAAFDQGSPFVPSDQIAMIHRGEAIVPAHLNSPFNPGSFSVNNQFVLPNAVDTRTQSQIAAMAGGSIQAAMRRNA